MVLHNGLLAPVVGSTAPLMLNVLPSSHLSGTNRLVCYAGATQKGVRLRG